MTMIDQSQRYNKIRYLLETDTGTIRICWLQPNDERTQEGGWVYDNRSEAESDLERFKKMPFIQSAWIEEREKMHETQ